MIRNTMQSTYLFCSSSEAGDKPCRRLDASVHWLAVGGWRLMKNVHLNLAVGFDAKNVPPKSGNHDGSYLCKDGCKDGFT